MGTGALPVRGARGIVEQALVDVIGLGLRKRGPTAANEAALAAMPSVGATSGVLVDGELRYVTAASACYVWRSASTATVATGVVQPTDRVASGKPGRWLVTSSTIPAPDGTPLSAVQSGYLRAVHLYQGETDQADWDLRIYSRRPACLIQWVGETVERRSNIRGALRVSDFHFLIWAISFNARPGYEAALGSPVSAESAADPGVSAIADDLTDLLDGLGGGLYPIGISVDGIDRLKLDVWTIKKERASKDLSQRLFILTAPLDVRCTIAKEDRPPRSTLDEVTATGVDPTDGTTPRTPQYQVIPT